jgi:UDP-N-acetylmuramate dehydrogenase
MLIKNFLIKLNAKENIPLSSFSTLRVGGPARYFVEPNSLKDLAELQKALLEHEIPTHILSGGSNTLFSDHGFNGVVIKLGRAFDEIKHVGKNLEVSAATSFAKTTKLALGLGWSKALGWCGTPGLIGGALRMNAGTRMGEIKDALLSITGINNGEVITLNKAQIEYSYRKSNLPKDFIICQALLGVDSDEIESQESLTPKIIEYKNKRRKTQPSINSLGSFFKNPYPMFAGQLIEQCGLKGLEYQGAQISPLHANFIINNKNASADDIIKLANIAQKTVFDKFGVSLEPEVRMVGGFL